MDIKDIQGDYGFINKKDMPPGNYISGDLFLDAYNFTVTGDFIDLAKNHCGAVFTTNLFIFLGGLKSLSAEGLLDIFKKVHKIIGNGPVLFLSRKSRRLFYENEISLHYTRIKSTSEVKDIIQQNLPSGMLLMKSLFNWHWVMIVGYRAYENGDFYYKIMDGWTRDRERYYRPDSGSKCIMKIKYWI